MCGSVQPEGPDGVDRGVGDCGGGDTAVAAPGSAIEDAGDGGKQDVTPVEVKGALVEVGEAEEDGGDEEGGGAAEAALEKILEPAAEEELLRHGDEEEGETPGDGDGRDGGPDTPVIEAGERGDRPEAVEMEEAEAEADGEGDGEVEGELAQAGGEVAQAEAEIEADAGERTQGEEAVEAEVEEQDLVEDDEMRGPGGLEPAEIDGEAEDGEDEEVLPAAALVGEIGIGFGGAAEEQGDGDGKQGVEGKPAPAEDASGAGDEQVGDGEQGGAEQARGAG